jgi:hypothetical protein
MLSGDASETIRTPHGAIGTNGINHELYISQQNTEGIGFSIDCGSDTK